MPTRTGTGHWASENDVRRYYGDEAEEAMREGRAVVGKPDLKPGQRLLEDEDGRYHIEDEK